MVAAMESPLQGPSEAHFVFKTACLHVTRNSQCFSLSSSAQLDSN